MFRIVATCLAGLVLAAPAMALDLSVPSVSHRQFQPIATIRRPPGDEPGGRRALDLFPARGEDAQQRDDRGAQHVIAHMA